MKTKMWAFVNSTFGVWCLSTLLIGSLSFGYTRYERQADRERLERQTEAERTRLEAEEQAHRQNQFERQVLLLCREVLGRTNQVRDLDSAQFEPLSAEQLLTYLAVPPHVQNQQNALVGVYAYHPDFERRPLMSIVQELEHLTYRQELNKVADKMRKLYDAAYFQLRKKQRQEGMQAIRQLTVASIDCIDAID